MGNDLELVGRVEVHKRAKEVRAMGEGFAAMYVNDLGTMIMEQAKLNVEPGKGPGPHPHRVEHTDTGALRDSVKMRFEHRGFLETVYVFSDLNYGVFLELGFHANWGGAFIQYPWLAPAYLQVLDSADNYLRATARLWFNETVQDKIQRSGITQLLSQKSRFLFRNVFGAGGR